MLSTPAGERAQPANCVLSLRPRVQILNANAMVWPCVLGLRGRWGASLQLSQQIASINWGVLDLMRGLSSKTNVVSA